mgnify:CR=1 FL=1
MKKLMRLALLLLSLASTFSASAAEERRFMSNSRLVIGTESELSASLRIGDLDSDDDLDGTADHFSLLDLV